VKGYNSITITCISNPKSTRWDFDLNLSRQQSKYNVAWLIKLVQTADFTFSPRFTFNLNVQDRMALLSTSRQIPLSKKVVLILLKSVKDFNCSSGPIELQQNSSNLKANTISNYNTIYQIKKQIQLWTVLVTLKHMSHTLHVDRRGVKRCDHRVEPSHYDTDLYFVFENL
jgi:hypothetical protein